MRETQCCDCSQISQDNESPCTIQAVDSRDLKPIRLLYSDDCKKIHFDILITIDPCLFSLNKFGGM